MTELATLDTMAVDSQAMDAVQGAQNLLVNNPQRYEAAAGFVKTMKKLRGQIDDTFDPVVKTAHAAHKEAVAAKKKHMEPVVQAEKITKGKMSLYVQEAERQRRKEEEKLRKEALKRAEEERLAAAEKAESAGDEEEVECLLDEAVEAAPVTLESTTPKIAGISYRTVWKYKIVDEAKIPRKYLKIDETRISQIVRAMKDETDIAGVEVYSEQTAAVGR